MLGTSKHKSVVFVSRILAPAIVLLLALILAFGVSNRFEKELTDKFHHESEHSMQIAMLKLDNYRDLLYAGRAFVTSSQTDSSVAWRAFYNQQSVFDRYPGVSSVSYVKVVTTAQLRAFETSMRSKDFFGSEYRLKTVSDRDTHGFVRSYVSSNDVSSIIGLDLLRSEDRYKVYESAAAKGTIVASPSVKFVTGYQGFFSVLAVYVDNQLDGYVLTTFRFDDLMEELFANHDLGYRVTDITDDKSDKLYQSKSWRDDGYSMKDLMYVGGRRWQVETSSIVEQRPIGYLLPAAIITTALLLSLALYLLTAKSTRGRASGDQSHTIEQ